MFRNAAWQRLMEICREPEGTGTGTETPPARKNGAAHDDEDDEEVDPRQSWKDYALSLRKQSSRYRRERNELRDKSTTAEAELAALKKKYDTDVAKAKADAEKQMNDTVAAATKKANDRIVVSEVRAQAMKEGVASDRLDDLLKLVDVSVITVDDAGNVKGADALIAEAKKSKPYLFGSASTSSPETPPPKEPAKGKTAVDMKPEEWGAELKKLGINSLR